MARIVITSGPTRQYIDPVRYLSNASSGQMGRCLCEAALRLGHEVTVISGPVHLTYPPAATVIHVVSTGDMLGAALKQFETCDGIIGAAAPCDYQPVNVADHKIRKTGQPLAVELVETQDIMAACGRRKREGQWSVGFALETDDARFRALTKLQKKNCDLVVLNGVSAIDSAENSVEIIEPGGEVIAAYQGDKSAVATMIIDMIQQRLIGPDQDGSKQNNSDNKSGKQSDPERSGERSGDDPDLESIISTDQALDGFRLQPTDPEVDSVRQLIRDKPLPHVSRSAPLDKPVFQFGVLSIMIVTAWVAFVCALFQFFDPQYVAGALGVAAIFSWIIIRIGFPESGVMRFWWILFAIYLAISGYAVAQSFF